MRLAAPLVLLAAAAGVAGAATPKPKTIAYANAPILVFAQDGAYVSWAATGCPELVRVRNVQAHTQTAVGNLTLECRFEQDSQLVSGGDRALWSARDEGNEQYMYVLAGRPGKKGRIVGENVFDRSGYGIGDHLGAIAGGGGKLVWSKIDVSVHGAEDCDETRTCVPYVKGGGVFRLYGLHSVKLPHLPPAVRLATDGKRVALVRAGIGGEVPKAKPGAKVEVYSFPAGNLVAEYAPAGRVRSLAVSGRYLAVLTPGRIELFAGTGKVWARTVPATVTSISLSGAGVVFHAGTAIRRIDLAGTRSVVATARAAPIGVSISGRRVAWAENVKLQGKLRGRIQAVTLP